MLRHENVLFCIVCLCTAGWVGQAFCQTQGSAQPQRRPDSRQSQQQLMEQKKKEFEKEAAERRANQQRWMAERRKEFEQRARDSANGKDTLRNEIIKQTLELTEAQWKVIEPKINKVYFLADQAGIKIEFSSGGASGGGGGGGQTWSGPLWRLADRELTEGEKTCEELLLLLDDKNSQQAQLDQKIDALRRARESAAKELTKARQELREVLTPRQQARLVLAGVLD